MNWISVNERLPRHKECVLAWVQVSAIGLPLRPGCVLTTFYFTGDGPRWECEKYNDNRFSLNRTVSHWAPLPPAPSDSVRPPPRNP